MRYNIFLMFSSTQNAHFKSLIASVQLLHVPSSLLAHQTPLNLRIKSDKPYEIPFILQMEMINLARFFILHPTIQNFGTRKSYWHWSVTYAWWSPRVKCTSLLPMESEAIDSFLIISQVSLKDLPLQISLMYMASLDPTLTSPYGCKLVFEYQVLKPIIPFGYKIDPSNKLEHCKSLLGCTNSGLLRVYSVSLWLRRICRMLTWLTLLTLSGKR